MERIDTLNFEVELDTAEARQTLLILRDGFAKIAENMSAMIEALNSLDKTSTWVTGVDLAGEVDKEVKP